MQEFGQLSGMLEPEVITWIEQSKAEGFAQGFAQRLVEGRIALLEKQARQKFDEASARAIAALLESITSEAVLEEVGIWLLTCDSGDALLAKIRHV